MSECVVRMEMPENCTCCPMCFTADVQGYHWCAALEQEVEEGLSRPKDCPIICSLPEGHGRLIDVEARVDELILNSDGNVVSTIQHTVGGILGDYAELISTIVPAEAERGETK